MTKKEFNALRHAMFVEWITTPDGKEFLKSPYDYCKCWRIIEGDRIMRITTFHGTQINRETLKANGFTEEASVTLLFTANRAAKTITPDGWWI